MSHVAPTIKLTQKQENILTKISTSRSLPKSLITRVQIILHASKGLQNKEISPKVFLTREMVGMWRKRWNAAQEILLEMEKKGEEEKKFEKRRKTILK